MSETNTQETTVTTEQPAAQPAQEQPAGTPERTFTQADVDRMIQDRLNRERRQHQQDIDNARSEGERLARMTAEQRAQQEAEQREQQLRDREAEITRRELRAAAIETLQSRDLPRELESMLDYASAEACNASIDNLEKVFRAAVQSAVDKRLKTSGVNLPAPGAKPDYAKMSDADYYAATYQPKNRS